MALRPVYLFETLKAGTLGLLGLLLFFLGSSAHQASISAYVSFFGILLLQAGEVFYPLFSKQLANAAWHAVVLRISIFLQLIAASVLVAVTDGSGSIYELVYLLPIVSAAAKLSGRDVILVVTSAIIAMIGFIVTGEQLTASIGKVKEFQDAVAAIVYFTMAGLLTYLYAKDERNKRVHYQTMAEALAQANAELRRTQDELTERLTQLTQMEEHIRHISQMAALGELAGQVAHEVRNPLGIIKGATEMLATRLKDPSTRYHIGVILEEVDRLNNGVEGILRLGTPLRIQTARFNAQDFLKSVAQTIIEPSGVRAVPVILKMPDTPLWIVGDRALLQHALGNFVRNGYQAMPSGSKVAIVASKSQSTGQLILTVTDTGVGLTAEDLTRLGEPFFTKRPGGVGLGFALAQRIITAHGGTLHVDSSPGQGTCITIHLPTE